MHAARHGNPHWGSGGKCAKIARWIHQIAACQRRAKQRTQLNQLHKNTGILFACNIIHFNLHQK
ncbi:hypothetical protein PATSB16_43620 [Pandoraea thiooxydans]|nr:hypothetical protein PATSB16_43620 [Pandoraea thiooxydans]